MTTSQETSGLGHDYQGTQVGLSDVNKDWTCKDKDQAYKDQDKDKDLTHKDQDKDREFTYSYLLQVAAKPTMAIKQ